MKNITNYYNLLAPTNSKCVKVNARQHLKLKVYILYLFPIIICPQNQVICLFIDINSYYPHYMCFKIILDIHKVLYINIFYSCLICTLLSKSDITNERVDRQTTLHVMYLFSPFFNLLVKIHNLSRISNSAHWASHVQSHFLGSCWSERGFGLSQWFVCNHSKTYLNWKLSPHCKKKEKKSETFCQAKQ